MQSAWIRLVGIADGAADVRFPLILVIGTKDVTARL
jgi:hypothetical protein